MKFTGDFINGKFALPDKVNGQFVDISPADAKDLILNVSYKLDHVDRAVQAAKAAYMPWARLSLEERKKYILKLKEVFIAHESEMAELIARDTGKALWDATTEAKALAAKIDITLNASLNLIAENDETSCFWYCTLRRQ